MATTKHFNNLVKWQFACRNSKYEFGQTGYRNISEVVEDTRFLSIWSESHLRLLRRPIGIFCTPSTVGPGKMFRTSGIALQPGCVRNCARRTLSGAYPLCTYDISVGN